MSDAIVFGNSVAALTAYRCCDQLASVQDSQHFGEARSSGERMSKSSDSQRFHPVLDGGTFNVSRGGAVND
jgi:hypothetical protein